MSIKLKGSTDGSVTLQAPADTSPTGTDKTFTLPTQDGTAGQILKTDGSGALSFTDNLSSGRNLVINGAMQVSQRGTSFTSNPNGYTLDRWRFSTSGGVFDVVQSSDAPAGFSNSLKVDCTATTTPTGNQEGLIETKIEAQDLQHLQYGTSGAQSVTLSFYVKSNKTGSYGLWVYQDDAGIQYATTYTISSANTWEYKTITIPGNTASAINNDNGTGLVFRFYLLAGSSYAGTPTEAWTTTLDNRTTSLNLGDSTANEWLITGVQIEVGSTATPFEHRSYGDELARCERYYQKSLNTNEYPGEARSGGSDWTTLPTTGRIAKSTPLKVRMRANPTVKLYDWDGNIDRVRLSAGNNQTGFSIALATETYFTVDTGATSTAELIYYYAATAEL